MRVNIVEKQLLTRRGSHAFRGRAALAAKTFCKNEDGGILIMSLMLLIVMLILGGMAVDFMRFESRRALLQSVTDRAVLAAAELDQTIAPRDVVFDYFEKAGFAGAIIGEPNIVRVAGSRSVQVGAEIALNTFFLRLAGIDTLEAPAASAAVEGTGNIEISLVLDISGSMNNRVYVPGRGDVRKYILLREAATGFVDSLLKPEYHDQISMSLVAYSANVSIGDELFDALKTTPATIVDSDTNVSFTNPARCLDFTPAEFATTTFDPARTYDQVERFDYFSSSSNSQVLEPSCPKESYEGIIPLTQDADQLKGAINQHSPRTYTAIHLGVKWGVSLLDPSMRDLLAYVPSVDPAFAGARPSDYATASSALSTVKYLVLMTDGENVAGRRIKPEYYDTAEEQLRWNTYNFQYWDRYIDGNRRGVSQYTRTGYSATQADAWMQSMCNAAKARNITIFSIAMGATSHGEDEMRECASTTSHYFATEGEALNDIFENIAKQITDLRLSL